MLREQIIKVYSDLENAIRTALGNTSNRMYRWRMVLGKNAPKIILILGDNNVCSSISYKLS